MTRNHRKSTDHSTNSGTSSTATEPPNNNNTMDSPHMKKRRVSVSQSTSSGGHQSLALGHRPFKRLGKHHTDADIPTEDEYHKCVLETQAALRSLSADIAPPPCESKGESTQNGSDPREESSENSNSSKPEENCKPVIKSEPNSPNTSTQISPNNNNNNATTPNHNVNEKDGKENNNNNNQTVNSKIATPTVVKSYAPDFNELVDDSNSGGLGMMSEHHHNRKDHTGPIIISSGHCHSEPPNSHAHNAEEPEDENNMVNLPGGGGLRRPFYELKSSAPGTLSATSSIGSTFLLHPHLHHHHSSAAAGHQQQHSGGGNMHPHGGAHHGGESGAYYSNSLENSGVAAHHRSFDFVDNHSPASSPLTPKQYTVLQPMTPVDHPAKVGSEDSHSRSETMSPATPGGTAKGKIIGATILSLACMHGKRK